MLATYRSTPGSTQSVCFKHKGLATTFRNAWKQCCRIIICNKMLSAVKATVQTDDLLDCVHFKFIEVNYL